MAKNANSIPMFNASRRSLGAGLFAVMAGRVITSGVAAGTAGDVVPAEVELDASLLCCVPIC